MLVDERLDHAAVGEAHQRRDAGAVLLEPVQLDRAVQLAPRDKALATELVYGALRYRSFLEGELERASSRGNVDLDPDTLAHLLVAGYQLFGLDRVPPFAAVNEAVSSIVVKSSGWSALPQYATVRRGNTTTGA